MRQTEAHKKVTDLLESKLFTRIELAEKLDLTRFTVYNRVKLGNWRQKEIDKIETL